MKIIAFLLLLLSNCLAIEFGERLDNNTDFVAVDSSISEIKTYIYLNEVYPDTSIKACFYDTKDGLYYQYSVLGTGTSFFNIFLTVLKNENGNPTVNITTNTGERTILWEVDDISYSLKYYASRNQFTFTKTKTK